MVAFFLSILASIIAALLVIFGAGIVSRRARGLLTALLTRWIDVDIEYVFKNKDEAHKDLHDELERSADIAILASRGNELQRATFSPVFLNPKDRKQPTVRVLLPATTLPEGEYDWAMQREKELASIDFAYGQRLNGKRLLHQLIEANVQFLVQHAEAGNIELRRFNMPHIGRVVVTENYVYYTPYRSDAHGRESKVYKFRRGGEMYDNLRRLFYQLWGASE